MIIQLMVSAASQASSFWASKSQTGTEIHGNQVKLDKSGMPLPTHATMIEVGIDLEVYSLLLPMSATLKLKIVE